MKRLWLDLGDPGAFVNPAGPLERWQDHGLGLLRTLTDRAGVASEVDSIRSITSWDQLAPRLGGVDMLLMNVRSYTFPFARKAARIYKSVNPRGVVVTGGMHATVAPEEMQGVAEFDFIVQGAGEGIIVAITTDPAAFERLSTGKAAASMDDWPAIDRRLWPRPAAPGNPWPLEPDCGWGPGPVATILSSRVCPWQCAFCNEAAYIPTMGRRSPESVVDELNVLDCRYGPLGSVVIHDSMFFQQPGWLERWLEVYPRRARRTWPYWAAARSDTVRRWPDLFEALVRETNWNTVSIGFESGSDRMLGILNKECSAADNYFTVDLLNRIGDEYVRRGAPAPKFWANIMLGIPGETREDAFDTMRMVKEMRYRQVSPAFYSPYPGSALGYQLMAEGRSLMTEDDYHRYPHDEKVRGVDYGFYRALLAGKYDDEIGRRPRPDAATTGAGEKTLNSHLYLFDLPSGGYRLGYGTTPDAALANIRERLAPAERAGLEELDVRNCRVIPQRDLMRYRGELA